MSFNIGDHVYVLRLNYSRDDAEILEGIAYEFRNSIDNGIAFYPFEAIILKFKQSIDTGRSVSMRTIESFYKSLLNLGSLRYDVLKPYIQYLDKSFIELEEDACAYPVGLVSTDRGQLIKYIDFLENFFDDKNVYDYIEENFR